MRQLTRDEEIAFATAWCIEHELPIVGFVIMKNGWPVEWQQNKPRCYAMAAGTVAIGMDGGGRFVVTQSWEGNVWKEVK